MLLCTDPSSLCTIILLILFQRFVLLADYLPQQVSIFLVTVQNVATIKSSNKALNIVAQLGQVLGQQGLYK